MKLHFYQCDICKKIITVISDSGVPTYCCGQVMQELVPKQTDAAFEKHVPVISKTDKGVIVKIGADPHPMSEDHSITWAGLGTSGGFQFKELSPGDIPLVSFCLAPTERIEAAYAFCNLHGLWSSK